MAWKTSKPHDSKDKRVGTHSDIYHTDSRGKRDQPKNTDLKISQRRDGRVMRDLHPPGSLPNPLDLRRKK